MLVEHIKDCLARAENYKSKLNYRPLGMEGMSGQKTRHFYNNICEMDDARYLEIGTWKGSSFCSAMWENEMTCLAIDNWSEFGGPRNQFLRKFNKFKGNNNATFLEADCWEVDTSKIGKFNIYMYDGCHTEECYQKALPYYLPALDETFIYLIDDWNWNKVRKGTMDSIKDNNLKIVWEKEIITTNGVRGVGSDWHNGMGIFILKKTNED